MSATKRFVRRLLSLLRVRSADEEHEREIATHLALIEEDLQRRGMAPAEARLAARKAFGSVAHARDMHREARSFGWIADLIRDVRHAGRSLARTPGHTAIMLLALAVGIGACTAVFSVVHAVLLRPLPYANADRLVKIFSQRRETGVASRAAIQLSNIAAASYQRLRDETRSFDALAGSIFSTVAVSAPGGTVRLEGAQLSANAFALLGVRPLLGRTFAASAGDEAVLSYDAWQRFFGGRADVVGRPVAFDGAARIVIGVMPQGFAFPDAQARFWIPYVIPTGSRNFINPAVVGRLAAGVSVQAAEAEVNAILGRDDDLLQYELVGLHEEMVADVRPALRLLTLAVAMVLLTACANVTTLLLARTAARRREIAVRVALGASRGRIVRQFVAEGLTLAITGGVAGTALALGTIRLLRSLGATLPRRDLGPMVSVPRLDEIAIDPVVLACAAGLAVATGVAIGILPALREARVTAGPLRGTRPTRDRAPAPAGPLRGTRPTSESLRGTRPARDLGRDNLRALLVVGEVAMAMMLLVGSGLLIHSFIKLTAVDLGFDPSHVVTFQAAPRASTPGQSRQFAAQVLARLQALPGVTSAGYANSVPLVQQGFARDVSTAPIVKGQSLKPPFPAMHTVSPDFVRTLGLRLLRGRGFSEGAAGQREMLVNAALVASGFLGNEPLGKRVYSSSSGGVSWEVVGVVQDVSQFGIGVPPDPQLYVVEFVPPPPGMGGPYFAVRTDADPTAVAKAVSDAVRQVDREATVDNVATMEEIVSNAIARPRLFTVLLGALAVVAVALSLAGIYGVISYLVAQRTQEIGIRMALGAQPSQVLRLVLRQGAALTAIGLVIGIAGAAAGARSLEGLLFGIDPLDPFTFAAAVLTFGVVATAASLVPARRATRLQPVVALRAE